MMEKINNEHNSKCQVIILPSFSRMISSINYILMSVFITVKLGNNSILTAGNQGNVTISEN
jgi:hypothetical protein